MAQKPIKRCLYPGCGKAGLIANMEPVHQICSKTQTMIAEGLLEPPDPLDGERDGECQARECKYHYVVPAEDRERDAGGRFV